MLKAYALRLHRWLALAAALPLLVLFVTGLVLSFEPLAQRAKLDRALTGDATLAYLDRYDPEGKANRLTLRPYEQTLTIGGVGPDGEIEIDLKTGNESAESDDWTLSELFGSMRGLHEHLIFDLGFLVIASTIAMLVLVLLGLLMGLPRLRSTVGGWHNVSAWSILPLAVLSPLTAIAMYFGITFAGAPGAPAGQRVPIRAAVQMLATQHDLSNLTSLRTRGGRLLARVYVDNRLTGILVTKDGLVSASSNWPRAIHEGNWHAIWGAILNIVASIVFIGLWVTGGIVWFRRSRRKRTRRRDVSAVPAE